MNKESVCRTCLSKKNLSPIFKAGDDHNQNSSDLFTATGLKVEVNDGLPQKMCKNCKKLLNNSLKFRQQSKDAEIKLLNAIKSENCDEKEFIDFNDCLEPNQKRKQSENIINIKIEPQFSDNDEETPLIELYKNPKEMYGNKRIGTKTHEKLKILTKSELKLHEQKKNNSVINSTKIDDDSNEYDNITDDFKYEVEFLDPNFDFNSDTEMNLDTNADIKSDLKQLYGIEATDTVTIINSTENLNNVTTDNNLIIEHNTNRVTCKLCQKNLSRRSIDSHMNKRHPGVDMRKVKCDLCDTFILKTRLNRHKSLMHGDCFRCGYCKTEFNTKELLLEHVPTCSAKRRRSRTVKSVTKRKEVLVECEICHKTMQKASLRLHTEVKHAGLGPVCEHCGRRFGNRFRLNEHQRARHGLDKYRCVVCGYGSASAAALKNHERRHRGERPFVCATCGASFHARHLLAQHSQSHRTTRNMKCDLCPAAFKANNTLHMHKLNCHNTHTYQCNMCPRTYGCRRYVVKHLRNVHRYLGPVGDLRKIKAFREPERSGDDEEPIGVTGSGNGVAESGDGVIESGNEIIESENALIRSANGVLESENEVVGSRDGVLESGNGVFGAGDKVIGIDNGVIESCDVAIRSGDGVIGSSNGVVESNREVSKLRPRVVAIVKRLE